MGYRAGLDIGGTFTDFVLYDGERRRISLHKCLTTPHDPSVAALAGLGELAAQAGFAVGDIGEIIHGTTLVTNAIIERRGAKVGLLTTQGFRDVLEMGTEQRYDIYDLFLKFPEPLVPRSRRLEIPERMDARGRVVTPLDLDAVRVAARRLADDGVEAIAVCFLHAYRNPAHERAAAEALRREFPQLAVSLSCEVVAELREYPRAVTTCANAYVQPLMASYLARFEQELAARGFRGRLNLMHSAGGLISPASARAFPIRLIESGPAGGGLATALFGARAGQHDVLAFDMGGTTAKSCLVEGGRIEVAAMMEAARVHRFKRGSGLPIKAPVIDMIETGAGGGSIAEIDEVGLLRVGPRSAGADPGPACYGRGGAAPTVTDADLLLGRIDPAGFAGGRMTLDRTTAEAALRREVAEPLDLAVELAALGVSEIVDENMANAARVHAIESGKDARGRTLVAFGGAAPLHAARMAEKLGLERVVVPSYAGVGSAVGFLRAPIAYEIVRSALQRLDQFDAPAANALYDAMRAEAEPIVRRGAGDVALSETRSAFMRYRGQGHEIAVQLPTRAYRDEDAALLHAAFEDAYRRLYSRVIPGVEVEVLSWVMLLSAERPAESETAAPTTEPHTPEPAHSRPVFDAEAGEFVEVAIHERSKLRPGALIRGPAVIVEDETSTVVSRLFDARIDAFGYIELTRRAG